MKATTEPPVDATVQRDASPRPTQSYVTDPLRIQKILVAVDFSEESLQAVDYAAMLAKPFGAGLHFAYVYDGEHSFASATPNPALLDPVETTRCVRDEVERRLGVRFAPGNCHVRMGRPFREVAATAEQIGADLIVVAAQGHTARPDALLGRTAEKLGADLILLHVLAAREGNGTALKGGSSEARREIESALLAAEDELERAVNFLPLGELSAEPKVELGEPIEVLVEETKREDLDLVIMSTHGRTGLRQALLGSVAEQMVRRAACPVLVVPSHCREVPK